MWLWWRKASGMCMLPSDISTKLWSVTKGYSAQTIFRFCFGYFLSRSVLKYIWYSLMVFYPTAIILQRGVGRLPSLFPSLPYILPNKSPLWQGRKGLEGTSSGSENLEFGVGAAPEKMVRVGVGANMGSNLLTLTPIFILNIFDIVI